MAADSGFAQLDRARLVRIETPEHVRLGFELAAIGSRFAAASVDLMVMAVLTTAILFALAGLGQLSASEWVQSFGAAGAALALFVVQWGYFFVAEGFFDGRTLGKRALGLRVIGAEGTPITKEAAALRNLLRVADVQPAGSSLIGLGLIALHPRAQRLGDIVAGTVVVRDRGHAEIPEQRAAATELGRPRLDPQRFEVLGK
ncbi:MAG TPA: RDD family protein, partial [Longimicrobiales bacterium]|nr:RDD family protein [Longimicrobiales bacterium]